MPPKLMLLLPAGHFGGAERVAFNLLQGIERFECTLLTQSAIMESFAGLYVNRLSLDEWGCERPYDLSLWNSVRYAWAIARVCRKSKPDVVLAFMHNGTFFASISRQLGLLDTCLIGSIHGNITGYFRSLGRSPSRWEKMIIRTSLSVPDGVVVPSQGVADDLVMQYSANSEKVKVITNGIDVEKVVRGCRDPLAGINKNKPWIVSACRLAAQKDFTTLLRAFRRVRQFKDARLLLVGDGEQRSNIEHQVAEMGLGEDVVLVGFQENPFQYMAQADVLVLSSHYEGHPVSIIEAFALGIPQVVTNCPSGPAELIEDGVNGFLVGMGDWEAMADRCLYLLENPGERQRMSEAALESAKDHCIEGMVDLYQTYLEGFVNGRSGVAR